MKQWKRVVAAVALAAGALTHAQAQTPAGEVKAGAVVHDEASRQAVIQGAQLGLPAALTRGSVYVGPLQKAPSLVSDGGRWPVVVFLHGSSGLGLKAIGEWQAWLASLGVASLAPDSFALKNRLTYTSPVDKATYEQVHALRASEIGLGLQALASQSWVDPTRLVLAGTSEGAVPVARYRGNAFAGRIIFSWSCEDNYFVQSHDTAIADTQPTLNVISLTDPYFSPANTWVGNARAVGHCGAALKTNKAASVVLIAGAPHTVLMLAPAKAAVESFLRTLVLRP